MKPGRAQIENFEGIVLNVHRARLKPQFFQIDDNGDRTSRGSWKPRRGLAHSNVAKDGADIDSIYGFRAADGCYVLLYTTDDVVVGVADVTTGVISD